MRIAMVLSGLGRGGAERLVVGLAERLAARGHQVLLVTLLDRAAGDLVTTVERRSAGMGRTPWGVVRGLMGLARELRQWRPELIHSHSWPGNMAARMVRWLVPEAKLLATIHNVWEGDALRMLGYRLTDSWVDAVTAVSSAAAARMVEIRAVRSCQVLTNGIDCTEFRRQGGRTAADGFVWIAVGRVVPAKDYGNLLQAFAQVHMRHGRTRLVIAGRAAGAEFARLRLQAAPFGDAVQWLGEREDVASLLETADGYVLSSAWEGMPLALAEAMAMELPVVATDAGGVAELVGDCGVLVPAHDATRLAEAMLAVMEQGAEQRAALGRKARTRIVEGFSLDARTLEWESLYRNLSRACSQHPSGSRCV